MKPNRTASWLTALIVAILFDHWKLFSPNRYSLLTGAEGVTQAYSWLNFWTRALSHGSLPLWDPYAFGGYSFPGEMQTAPFYPLYLVLLLFRRNQFGLLSGLQYNGLFVGAHVLAAVCMFAFVRDLGLSRFAAFVAGFSFSSAGFVGSVAWPHMLQSAIWLPLIALFFRRALLSIEMRGRVRNALFAGFFLGLSLLAGGLHVAMAQAIFVLSAAGYFAVAQRPRIRAPEALRIAAPVAITFAAALGLAAVQLLPSHLYSQHSLRWVGEAAFPASSKLPYMYLTQSALSPAAIVSLLFPVFEGLGSGETWGIYIGVLPFLFAALAVAKQWRNLWVRFLLALSVAAFLYSLAGLSALHGVLYVVTPFLWMAREATRFVYLTNFSLCVMAAYGLEYLCTAIEEGQLWMALKRGVSYGIAACLALFLLPVFVSKSGGPWQYFSLLVILMSCILLRCSLSKSNWRMQPSFRILVIGLLFFDLNAFNWSATNKIEAASTGDDALEVLNSLHGAADYLKQQPQPFRVRIFHDPEPNIGDAYGIPSLAGGGVSLDQHAVNVLHDSDLMNAQYFIKPAALTETGFIYQDEHWKIYSNVNAFPRYWIVHSFKREQNEVEMMRDLRTRHSELRQIAFISESPSGQVATVSRAGTENIRLDSFSANEILLSVNTPSPGLLILGEMHYPEWHAFVDGRETKIIRADEALRSVWVPAGKSSVQFSYRPTSVYLGAFFSILTGVVIVAALFWRGPVESLQHLRPFHVLQDTR